MASTLLATPTLATDTVFPDEPAAVPQDILQPSLLIGAGAGFKPRYEGSDEYRAFPIPIISYDSGESGPDRVDFRSLDDIRFYALPYGNFSVGPLAGYTFGRDESDSNRLRGLGDIDGGLIVGGFASYRFVEENTVSWSADIGISAQVTGDAFDTARFAGLGSNDFGYEADFSLSGKYDVNERLNVAMRLGAVYASDDFMQTHFGVTNAQAAAANALGNTINTFDANSGFKNVYFNIKTTFELTDTIQLRAGLGYSRLLGDASDSPITENENQFSGSLGAAYRIRF